LHANVLEKNIKAWVEDLPDRQREAFVLSRFNGLSHDEIAAVMGVSPRTVNNHIVRALKTLRDHVRALEPSLLDR
jgi:RNA polymerase sigma-70 factor (ECF subfamily)